MLIPRNNNSTKALLVLLPFFLFSHCNQSPREPVYLDKELWKDQALEQILPPWTKYARDTVKGSFFCSLDGDWKPIGDSLKFPSMIARHLFSYSAAYLMGGRDKDLKMAEEIKDYLISHAWDAEYGGWFDALSRDGHPRQLGKSTFVQVYVITGLAMYYFVTHDSVALEYIDRSNALLEEKVWDHSLGGYFDDSHRDWTLRSEVKSFASQLAPVSGYLLYLHMATRDEKYLRQAERICDDVLRHMVDKKSGWVLESFDKNWNYQRASNDQGEINVGHNIETAWSLARLHRLNNREDYLHAATVLSDSLHHYGFNSNNGFWFTTIGNGDPAQHSEDTYWWIQAYGNMFDLYLAGLLLQRNYTKNFLKGAAFWDTYFLDKEKGDTHFSVLESGTVKDYRKANQYKSSYHNMEHCLLNYLYLGSWVNPEPLTLYFKVTSAKGDKLYPLPIEKLNGRIKEVTINGEAYGIDGAEQGLVILPALNDANVAITLY